jgi:hypothetical protein
MGFLRRFRGGSGQGGGPDAKGVYQDQETGEIIGVKGPDSGAEPLGVYQDQETGEIIGVVAGHPVGLPAAGSTLLGDGPGAGDASALVNNENVTEWDLQAADEPDDIEPAAIE